MSYEHCEWLKVWMNYSSLSDQMGKSCCTTEVMVDRVHTHKLLFFSLPSVRLVCAGRGEDSELCAQNILLNKNIFFAMGLEGNMKICIFLTGILTPSLVSSTSNPHSGAISLQQTQRTSILDLF